MNFRGAKGDTVLASLRRNLHSAVLTLATDLDLASGPVEVRGERPSGWIQVMAGMNFRGAKGDTPDTTFVAIVEG